MSLVLQNFTTGATPKRAPKGNYGTVRLLPVVSILDRTSRRHKTIISDIPICFEDMDLNNGLALYETHLPSIGEAKRLPLVINSLRDRATVFLNHVRVLVKYN